MEITYAGINPNILARLGKGNMFQWKVCIRFARLLIDKEMKKTDLITVCDVGDICVVNDKLFAGNE